MKKTNKPINKKSNNKIIALILVVIRIRSNNWYKLIIKNPNIKER